MRVDVLVFDGFDELDAMAPYEVLSTARGVGADVQPSLVGPADAPVTGRHGTTIIPDRAWQPGVADILVVAGGGWSDRPVTGVRALIDGGTVPRQLHDHSGILASVCTGAMLLAAAGLTKGRPCTTHHTALADLESMGGTLVDARVVDDGDLITAGGVTSGLDLALWLLEREVSADVAVSVERLLEYQRRGTVWRSPARGIA